MVAGESRRHQANAALLGAMTLINSLQDLTNDAARVMSSSQRLWPSALSRAVGFIV